MFYDRGLVGDGRGLSAQIRQVRPAQADGAGRDGRDLSRGHAATPASRSSASSRRSSRRTQRSREGQPVPRRGQGRASPVARQPGADLRRRRDRRRVLHRDGPGRRQGPARDLEPLRAHADAHPAGRRAARRARGRARAVVRPRLRRPEPGPPRRRAAQHPAQLLRRGEADRLRAGAQRAEEGADRARRRVRPRVVPGARAGARRGRRRAHRHLQPGDRAVGAADREPVPAAREPRSGDRDVAGAPSASRRRRRPRRPGSRRRSTSC